MRFRSCFVLRSLALLLFVFQLSACGSGGGGGLLPFFTAGGSYSVGGRVDGLKGTLVLQNYSGDELTVTSNGAFTFATKVLSVPRIRSLSRQNP